MTVPDIVPPPGLACQAGALYSANMPLSLPSQVYRIGTLAVRIPHCPLPGLRGLLRYPTAETEDAVTLEFQMVDEPDWSPTLERGGARFVKALGAHWCEIDFPARHATIRFRADLDRTGWYFLFRDIFAALCGLSGDVFLHASSVTRDGQAMAFCAFSGGGKSTIAQLLAPETDSISDEINWAFRDEQGQFRLVDQRHYRTPPTAAAPDLPLAAVFVLAQAPTCAVTPIDPASAYPILLAAPFGDDPLLPRRAQAAAALLDSVPVRRLAFNLRSEDVRRAVWGEPPGHA